MVENCVNDAENTLMQYLIEVCHVLQHQYTNQCTLSRVVAAGVGVVGAAAAPTGVVTVTSSSSITGIPDLMQLCMNIINYNLLILSDDYNSIYTKNVEK